MMPLKLAQQWVKSLLVLSLGLFGLLVGLGNVLDYNSNWQFVQHVLAMDAMEAWFDGAALKGRAITDPALQTAAYLAIIASEILFGLLCAFGGVLMLLGTLRRRRPDYVRGKTWFTLGAGLGLLLWFTGFAVIGAEYFAMWASQWNGQTKAYTFAGFILLSLIYVSQPEDGA